MKGFAFCGSFCTHRDALIQLDRLVNGGEEIIPLFSEKTLTVNTRFGEAEDLVMKAETICGRQGIKSVAEAEKQITGADIDCLIVAPCTGNTLAKAALGITDGTVPMAIKAQLRNQRPVLFAFASNDGLGASLKNIAALVERKNVFFVPLRQDDPVKKPNSLVCDWSRLPEAAAAAVKGVQLRPLIVS